MFLKQLFVKKPHRSEALYAAIVAAARQPRFFASWSVPDTVDGRFDMMVLHMFLMLQRLKAENVEICQQLTDLFFKDMDRSLREMGVGDLAVGKKVRKMAEGFYGRLNAYGKVIDGNETELTAALHRNVYADDGKANATPLAQWAMATHQLLATQKTETILNAEVNFG